ncbi:MAG: 4Fe-4S binding protein [Anaerohalosphaera sp.]|nr:4Fe-4S binding protein [Anaerohalosphaera sp.]
MAIRNIVKIDEEKCNGCGDCVTACAEGAIQIIEGKAKLVSEVYCDGLGACLGHCPMDAITVEKREAAEFDEEATNEYLASTGRKPIEPQPFVCPGSLSVELSKKDSKVAADVPAGDIPSQLGHWPVQLKLVSPMAQYFKDSDILLVADCVPFAMADFHQKLLKGKNVVVGCPKLDDCDFYIEKLADILKMNTVKSLTVVHMEVPCCSGLCGIAKEAIRKSGVAVGFEDITISLDGGIKAREKVT